MNAGQIADLLISRLTADGEVCLDIERTVIEKLVFDAFREACPWFDNPPYYVTKAVVPVLSPQGSATTGGYVDLTKLDPQIQYIREVHTVKSRYYHTGDIIRDLLLLPAAPLETQSIEEHAAWQMAWPMVKEMLGRDLAWTWDEQKKWLWVDDANEGAVTIDYIPVLTSVDKVLNQKALTWIISMTEARTLQAIARVRGKFRGGLTMETDASDMLSEATEKVRQLTEDLRTLHFIHSPR